MTDRVMRTSLFTFLGDSQGSSPVDDYVRDLRDARDQGFEATWTVQLPWEADVFTTLAVAVREVEGITVGRGCSRSRCATPWRWRRRL